MKGESHIFAIGIEEQVYSNSKIAMGFIQIGKFEERFELTFPPWIIGMLKLIYKNGMKRFTNWLNIGNQ
jgi:hypothetical protein